MEGREVLITPEMATELLSRNRNIRSMSKGWVRFFVLLLELGEFVVTPDGICLDGDGDLINGQHRLQAIVDSGIPARMMLWNNVTDEQMRAMDGGKKRQVSDSIGADKRVVEIVNPAVRLVFGAPNYPPSYVDKAMASEVGAAAGYLIASCGTKTKFFSAGWWKLGAVVQMVSGADWKYVGGLYRSLVLAEVEDLPPIGIAIMRQAFSGMCYAANKSDTLARSLVVFDPAKQNTTKVQINDASAYVGVAREALAPHFSFINEARED